MKHLKYLKENDGNRLTNLDGIDKLKLDYFISDPMERYIYDYLKKR